MAFEPFKSAGRSVQVVNAFILLFLFLSWVSTMVTFGSILHKLTIYENNYLEVARFEFYWDRVHITADNIIDDSFGYDNSYLQKLDPSIPSSCKGGGDGTLAFAIFAFLAFLIHLTLTVCRITGLNHPLARDTQHSLYIELVLSCVEWFCFFLTTTIWGGSCYSPSRGLYGGSITGVGYGLMIACFFFLTFNTVMYFLMRSNESLVLGNGASRGGGGGGSGGYEAGGGGEYSSEQQPTFSYQGNGSDSTAL